MLSPLHFGKLTADIPSLRKAVGKREVVTYAMAAKQLQGNIDSYEMDGVHFRLEGIAKEDPKRKGARFFHFQIDDPHNLNHDPKWKKGLALVSLVDADGKPLGKTFANERLAPGQFLSKVLERTRLFVDEQKALIAPVKRTPLRQKTRTPFPVLEYHAERERPGTVRQERLSAGLDQLPAFVHAERRPKGWWIMLPADQPLPTRKALALHRRLGEDVQAFGEAWRHERLLEHAMQGRGGVTAWSVRTQEGLAELVAVLKRHFSK